MKTPKRCPKCGAKVSSSEVGFASFLCGSWSTDDHFFDTVNCLETQVAVLKRKLALARKKARGK